MLTRQSLECGSDGASTVVMDPATMRARLASVAESIERGGVDSDPVSVLLVAHAARDLDVSPVLVSVLADETAPAVARERAFGRVSAAMESRLDAIHSTAMLPSTC
jgi:hypothetical protein